MTVRCGPVAAGCSDLGNGALTLPAIGPILADTIAEELRDETMAGLVERLRAARAAGLRCGITCSRYFADAGFEGAAWLRPDLETPRPMTLQTLQALDGAAESETRPRGRP